MTQSKTRKTRAGGATAASRKKLPFDPDAPPVSVDEVIQTYPGEWILLKITDYDESKWPSHGHVVAHSKSHARVWRRLAEVVSRYGWADLPYYVFSAYPHLKTGDEVRQALKNLQEEYTDDSFHWPR